MYFPDPQHATAGIHFARVLDALGIRAQLGSRLHAYPNGAIALRQLASAAGERLIGIAQITEIAHAANVALVGGLPPEFGLATMYKVGVCRSTRLLPAARDFVRLLTGKSSHGLREMAGFELP